MLCALTILALARWSKSSNLGPFPGTFTTASDELSEEEMWSQQPAEAEEEAQVD